MLEDEWNIKDTVLRRAGENYGKKWSMQVNVNPYGMYFATVQVGDKVEHWGLYSEQAHAEIVGYQKLADMFPAILEVWDAP